MDLKDKSIETLNKCLEELTSMSQEGFDKRDKEITNMSCIKESTCLLKNMRGICGLENCISFEKECKHEFVFDGAFCRLCGKAAWETIKLNKEIKMKDLKDYTIEELESEIKKRRIRPEPKSLLLNTIEVEAFRKACKEYIDELVADERNDLSNHRNEIFEKAMELCYGQDVWQYTNSFYKD